MSKGINQEQMLDAGVHFGHQKRKWNPKMSPYILMEKKGIHLIDVRKTNTALMRSAAAMRSIARSGREILFVATKRQAKDIVIAAAKRVDMPYMCDRWPGGLLTNYATARRSVKKMQKMQEILDSGAEGLVKKERLMMERERDKLNRVLGGIADIRRIPAAIFIVDITQEHIALAEAKKLNLTTFAMVDTNSDPTLVDFPIPANDDASKSISLITNFLVDAIEEGKKEYLQEKEQKAAQKQAEDSEETASRRRRATGTRRRRGGSDDANAKTTQSKEASTPTAETTETPKTEEKASEE